MFSSCSVKPGAPGLQLEVIEHQAPGLRPSTESEQDLLVSDCSASSDRIASQRPDLASQGHLPGLRTIKSEINGRTDEHVAFPCKNEKAAHFESTQSLERLYIYIFKYVERS